jgi:hypothetical protein
MRRRRRSRSAFDPNTLLLTVIVLFLVAAWFIPGMAFAAGMVFGLAAAVLWYVGARKRLVEIHRWSAVSNLYVLSPEEFERHVAATYAALGYSVSVTRRVGDQGIDVLAERGGERLGIQCKRTTEPASNGAIQEVYAGKAHYHCTAAAVISLGGFTRPAQALAKSTAVELVDGAQYADLFHRATAALPKRSLMTVVPGARVMVGVVGCVAAAAIALTVGGLRAAMPPMTEASIATPAQGAGISPGAAVERFYSEINGKDFRSAYERLSPSFRKSMPFDTFRTGYATTMSVIATTTDPDDGPVVQVHLIAVDRNGDGTSRTTTFDGYWKVVPGFGGDWLLDDGRFHKS